MTQQAKRKRSVVEWQALVLRRILRLARTFGQWPSAPEVSRSLRCSEKWMLTLLAQMRDEELVVCVGSGAMLGWMPTAVGFEWLGESMPSLRPGCAAPRMVRARGLGAVRAWNGKQRLKARLAAAQVFDRDAVSGGGEFEG